MCSFKLINQVKNSLLRNNFGENFAATTVTQKQPSEILIEKGLKKCVDLTHTLHPKFPTYSNKDSFLAEPIGEYSKDGYNSSFIKVTEHVGTHIDAPFHFSENGKTVDEIEIENLIVPLVVIDNKDKALKNEDYKVSKKDIQEWENENNGLPENCCIAINSGWDKYVDSDKFRNEDAHGKMHFPSFGLNAAEYLLQKTSCCGIAVDTLSIDYGMSEDFEVHQLWLSNNKWGLEAVKNLDLVPKKGAYIFVGAPKHKNGSGGQCRLIALF